MPTNRQRRARRRRDIQLIRKSIRKGECPCWDFRIRDPGPHVAPCPWLDPDYQGEPFPF